MARNTINAAVLLVLLLVVPIHGQQARREPPYQPGELCDEVVTTLYPAWSSKIPRERLARVEVRNCRVEDWGFLQIAAWNEDAIRPSLVADTKRSTIVRTVMAGNVFVLETAGASSDVVQIVVYRNGRPELAFSDATRADVRVETTPLKVIVRWPQEKGPERVLEFSTGAY